MSTLAFAARLCTLLYVTAAATVAHAGLSISGSRIIYDEARGETAVQIEHTVGNTPALMQVWLDDGDPGVRPGQQDLPFILNPAVAHMIPGRTQAIRVMRTGELPSDRESLLYFNVLEIPPDMGGKLTGGENIMQIAMQARLKFFYRPRGLTPSVAKAPDLLRFAAEPGADGKIALRITNPTPYHITFTNVTLHASGADSAAASAQLDTSVVLAPMIAPHGELTVTLKPAADGLTAWRAHTQVRYTIINDFGGKNTKLGKLDPS